MKTLNKRMETMDMSGGLYEIFQKALLMEKRGEKIFHMEIGKPDYDSPEIAKAAVKKALDDGFVHYTAMAGIDELRQAIAEKEKRENGIYADPEREVMVTAGACEALLCFMLTALDPGDDLLIPAPYFSAYKDMAHISGVNIVEVPLRFEKGFRLQTEDIEAKITKKTRALIVNTPHNPTGVAVGDEELTEISKLAVGRDLLVVSDETYDQFLFSGRHMSISTLPQMRDRTIVVNSTSKTFSMTGWRIGYAIGPAEIIRYMNKVHQNMSTCATSFVQYGAAEAFRNGKPFTENMVREFKKRRDVLMEGLSNIDGIQCVEPKGAFYTFPRIADFHLTSADFCTRLLEETGVAAVPGSAFGDCGEGFIRLAYACSEKEIAEAMKRLKRFAGSLKTQNVPRAI